MRTAPTDELVAQAPPEIAEDIRAVTADWIGYLDLVASIPEGASGDEAMAILGLYGPATIRISEWLEANC